MQQTTGWILGGLVILVVLLGAAVALLSARLRQQHKEIEQLAALDPLPAPEPAQAPAPAALEPPTAPALEPMPAQPDERFRREVVQGAQEALGGTMRRILALTNNAAGRLHDMQRTHGPDVLEDLLPIDHLLAQAQRRAQLVTVLCGSPPGQQRTPQLMARLVGAAQSRIHDYERVRLSTRDTTTAVLGRVVEPLSAALAELLDNATRSSPPTAPVDVLITAEYHGVSLEIHDGGVGMPPDALNQANALLSRGDSEIELTELGNPPRTGLAGCSVLAANYGFTVRLDAASSRGGLRAVLLVPHHLLTTLEQQPVISAGRDEPALVPEPAPAPAPAPVAAEPDAPRHRQPEPATTTAAGLPKRPRRTMTRSGDLSAPDSASVQPIADGAQRRTTDAAQGLRGLQRATRATDDGDAATEIEPGPAAEHDGDDPVDTSTSRRDARA
ncbi:ATP-binding protein [Saccharopolyspora sp. NPDC047091]|uniref:ATP-binding protein n=1 Tax=Saccharopolyspora sp. NPDC047091 TaxID=3155924 RepID=UPI0033C9142A